MDGGTGTERQLPDAIRRRHNDKLQHIRHNPRCLVDDHDLAFVSLAGCVFFHGLGNTVLIFEGN